MNSLGHYSNVSIDIKPSLFKVFIFVLFSDSDSKYLMIYKVIAKYTEILYILCQIISYLYYMYVHIDMPLYSFRNLVNI